MRAIRQRLTCFQGSTVVLSQLTAAPIMIMQLALTLTQLYAHAQPEFRYLDRFYVDNVVGGLSADVLNSSHPLASFAGACDRHIYRHQVLSV